MTASPRAELGLAMQKRTEDVILLTAFLFLTAGSLWMHLSMGPVAFSTPFVLSWLLIHGGAFVAVWRPSFKRLMPIAGLAALNLHFYACARNLGLPFFPVAPLFFLVGTLSLSSFPWARFRGALSFWLLGWASAALWAPAFPLAGPLARQALLGGGALNLIFMGTFLAALRFFSARMRAWVGGLGGRWAFDRQRIHAATLQTLGELASSLSHEIQNPLTSISGYSFQIAEDLKTPDAQTLNLVRSANERIKFNVDRIIEISRVIRNFSRESTKDDMRELSVRAVIEDTLLLIRTNLKASGVDFHAQLPEEELRVHGNLVQLSQLLVNLLSNARDACRTTSRRRVELGARREDGMVEIWVEDTGPGIPAEVGEKIFQPFFTTKPAGEGTGLGLHIAMIVARKHDATLSYDCPRDARGRVLGTRFSFRLPEAVPGQSRIAA